MKQMYSARRERILFESDEVSARYHSGWGVQGFYAAIKLIVSQLPAWYAIMVSNLLLFCQLVQETDLILEKGCYQGSSKQLEDKVGSSYYILCWKPYQQICSNQLDWNKTAFCRWAMIIVWIHYSTL